MPSGKVPLLDALYLLFISCTLDGSNTTKVEVNHAIFSQVCPKYLFYIVYGSIDNTLFNILYH